MTFISMLATIVLVELPIMAAEGVPVDQTAPHPEAFARLPIGLVFFVAAIPFVSAMCSGSFVGAMTAPRHQRHAAALILPGLVFLSAILPFLHHPRTIIFAMAFAGPSRALGGGLAYPMARRQSVDTRGAAWASSRF